MSVFAHNLIFLPFVTCVTTQLVLFVVLCSSRAQTRYRGFESYVAVSLASALVCLGSAAFGSTSHYFYAYYFAQIFKAAALSAALYEQFAILFLPRWVMPSGALRSFAVSLSAILLLSIAVAVLTPQATPYLIVEIGRRFVGWHNTAIFCGLIALLIAKDHYGVYLRARCRAIIAGLLSVTGLGILESLALAYSSTRRAPEITGYITTIAFSAVACSWAKHFATSEEIHLVLTKSNPETVCLKKSPTSSGLTAGYARRRLLASGEQKAKQWINR